MSFKIGQLRRNQLNNYQIEIDKNSIEVAHDQMYPGNWTEGCIVYQFKEGQTYLIDLSATLNKHFPTSTAYVVYIKLYSGDTDADYKEMIIKQVPGGYSLSTSQPIVFTPNRDYDYLAVQINRDNSAHRISDIYYNITVDSFYKLNDVLKMENFKQKFPELKSIKKLGLQGPEGMSFALNGEEFKIGKSGIYSVSDVEIEELCFYLRDAKNHYLPFYEGESKEFFIMDFEY